MVIGITGSLGAGKSTLARLLVHWGAVLVDADEVARRIVARPEVLGQLQQVFGQDIVDEQGRLQRRELGRRALASDAAHQRLEQIVRPPLAEALWQELEEARQRAGEGLVVLDAPLLYEWGAQDRCDLVIAVDADETVRHERLARRSGWSRAEILQRLARQLPAAQKRVWADYAIDNSGDLAALEQQARALWQQLQDRRKAGVSREP
jgi:dephospho-CoA kinase